MQCVNVTCAPASSSSLTHCACPRIAASCRGVMESTATIFTEAPLWIRLCRWDTWPWYAALWTSVLSDQKPNKHTDRELVIVITLQVQHGDHKPLEVQDFWFKPLAWVTVCRVLWFPPKHASRWTGYLKFPQGVWMCVCVCGALWLPTLCLLFTWCTIILIRINLLLNVNECMKCTCKMIAYGLYSKSRWLGQGEIIDIYWDWSEECH